MEGLEEKGYVKQSNIENIKRAEVEKKKKHLGKIRMIRGLTLWEVNYEEGTIVESKPEPIKNKAFVVGAQEQSANKKLVAKENCFYIQALNMKNAIKKSDKWLQSINNNK